MNEIVKEDVISILKEVINILSKNENNSYLIKELSNHTIHDSTIFQDDDAVTIAVIIYALSKLLERKIDGDLKEVVLSNLIKAKESLEKNDIQNYRERIDSIFKEIKKKDEKIRMYMEDVLRQAAVRKATKIHEHGVSLTRVARILGISQWELMRYVGNTKIPEEYDSIYNLGERIKFAKSIFNVK